MKEAEEQTWLTVAEVADRYRTSTSTVYDWIYKKIAPPSVKMGKRRLFNREDLLAWEEDRKEQDREGAA